MRITVKRVIPAPPEQVFAFVADMRNDPEWAPMVHDVEQLEGDGPGEGARYRFLQSMGRHQIEMVSTIVRCEPPYALAWRIDHKAMDYAAQMRFAPHRRGTRVVQTNDETWHFAPWWLRLTAPLLVRRQLRHQLARLEAAIKKEGEEEGA